MTTEKLKWFAVYVPHNERVSVEAMLAESEQEAIKAFMNERELQEGLDCFYHDDEEISPENFTAQYVPEWNGKEEITPMDYLKAGFTWSCAACQDVVNMSDETPSEVKGLIYCEWCTQPFEREQQIPNL